MTEAVNTLLLLFMCVTALTIVRQHNLFAVVMLGSVFSLLSAGMFVLLDAVDVAFTEAAVGAGISTILMLGVLSLTNSRERITFSTPIFPIVLVMLAGSVLIFSALGMPEFGAADAPIHGHVADRYIEKSGAEVGLPNIVTSILASYRGFDTLGEVTVIFTAGIGVMVLLGLRRRTAQDGSVEEPPLPGEGNMRHHLVLRVTAKLLIPFIMLFALYVQFHGDFGPGGGFQAGVIFAAAFILYGLVFGIKNALAVVPEGVTRFLIAAGVLLYAGVGIASLLMGGNYLDYGVLAHEPTHGQHLGILLIEFGVGTTVAAVMITLFFSFARRARKKT
jgi:multicomponent Na+:H+ antiporter subunit B